MHVLPSIERTRKTLPVFLIIEKKSRNAILHNANKASIIITLADKVGSLLISNCPTAV
jgi:hypothetical protein